MRLFFHLAHVLLALVFGFAACSNAVAPDCKRRALAPRIVGANLADLTDYEGGKRSHPRGYGSPAAQKSAGHLSSLGLNAVALPVELFLSKDRTKIEEGPLLTSAGLKRLRTMIRQLHKQDLAVMVIPHLLLRDNAWRGEISPAEGERFLPLYQEAIAPLLALAEQECVESFSVAVEFKAITTSPAGDKRFGALIKKARALFKGHLSYSANWDEVDDMRHWSQLDSVGVNAFFPLANDAQAQSKTLQQNAKKIVSHLEGFAKTKGKKIVFNELGYRAQKGSFVKPWLWPRQSQGVETSERTQAMAYGAMLEALKNSPHFQGVYFWVVPSDLDDVKHKDRYEGPGGFSFVNKSAEEVVSKFAREFKGR